jgi:Ca-activated chloride channel family protein
MLSWPRQRESPGRIEPAAADRCSLTVAFPPCWIGLVFVRASGRIRSSLSARPFPKLGMFGGAVKRELNLSARNFSRLRGRSYRPAISSFAALWLTCWLSAAIFAAPANAILLAMPQAPTVTDKPSADTNRDTSQQTPALSTASTASSMAATNTTAAAKDAVKSVDDVRKDTPAVVVNPRRGLKMDVDLALINATVTDPFNRLVTGLDPDNFRIYEDNVEQEVVSFSSEDVPISIGVIFDYSGSMANKAAKAREAALQFFKTANPLDEFFLVSFNERAELASSFTNSVEDLQSRMLLTNPKGRTALLDAIYLGLSEMRSAHNAKRALLILSDGGDNHSRYTEGDIKRLVKEADTQLYAIGIFDPAGYRNRTLEEGNGPSLLSEVTELTGGRVFPVEKLEELPDIATKIGMELRNQYVLGYHPSNKAHDARWRKVKVKLRPPRGLPPLTVYNKTGYYAPSH